MRFEQAPVGFLVFEKKPKSGRPSSVPVKPRKLEMSKIEKKKEYQKKSINEGRI